MEEKTYPLTFSVDYPDRHLSRLSTFFRIIALIPIAIVLATVSGGTFKFGSGTDTAVFVASGGFLFAGPLLMLLFRKKYPAWWAEWNRELMRFVARVAIYAHVMDDTYPSTDEQQSVHLDFENPNGEQLSRGMPLIKWLLAIPHYVVLFFLYIGVFVVTIIAWFAILFTGRYPQGLFEYVEGVFRWHYRVAAYMLVLITDQYPPFSLK